MPIKKQQNLNFTFNFHDKCRLSFREMITRRQCCHQSFDQIGAFFIGTLANQEFIKEESQCSGIFLDQVRHPRFEDMFSDQGSAWSIRLHKFSQKSKLSNRQIYIKHMKYHAITGFFEVCIMKFRKLNLNPNLNPATLSK